MITKQNQSNIAKRYKPSITLTESYRRVQKIVFQNRYHLIFSPTVATDQDCRKQARGDCEKISTSFEEVRDLFREMQDGTQTPVTKCIAASNT